MREQTAGELVSQGAAVSSTSVELATIRDHICGLTKDLLSKYPLVQQNTNVSSKMRHL